MRKARLIAASLAFLAICIAFGVWLERARSRPTVPFADHSSAMGPRYVDENLCGECHSGRADSHQSSGHASTFRASRESEVASQLAGKTFADPERGLSYQYHLEVDGALSVSLAGQLGGDRFPLDYVLGSGQNAVSFLSLVPDGVGDTVGIEHRVSLYRGDDDWEFDLTPGHKQIIADQEVELFGRVIRGDTLTGCIGCHTVTAEISGHQLTDLRANVGCQSCHGPGGDHVAAMRDGATDRDDSGYAAVTRQSAADEIALCGRCHRLPVDTPAADLSPNIVQNVRFQPAGLIQSKCFLASGDLRCSTCHDPHQTVSRDHDHYVKRCLDCHGAAESVRCPVSPQDDCIGCHMPAIDVHRGIEFHDHWIRVRQDVRVEDRE